MTEWADAQGNAGERFHTVTIVGRCGRGAAGRSGRRAAEELSAASQLLTAMTGGKKPVVADAVKARRQDVEQKAADEFAGGQSHRLRILRSIGTVVLVGEADAAILDVEQSVIGNRHAMRVATDVVEDLLRAAEWPLGEDDPFGLPQHRECARPGWPILEWRQRSLKAEGPGVVRGLEVLEEEATEQAREHAHGQEESRAAGDPLRAVGRETAAWNHTVQMGMSEECLAPRVEHRKEPQLGPEMFGISGDGSQGLGGRPKQEVVQRGFVLRGNRRHVLGHREDDVEVFAKCFRKHFASYVRFPVMWCS